jgi:hypothetical protein
MKSNSRAKMAFLTTLLIASAILTLQTLLVPHTSATYEPIVIYKELTQISTGHREEAPSIVVDHNGNLNIVWIGNDTANLYYMMVDRYGNTLINETCLDPNMNATWGHVRRASIGVDSHNNVHIVFHAQNIYEPWPAYTNYTSLAAQEVLYLKINPYSDDMNGSPADYVAITVIPETIISTKDSSKSRAANIAVDSENRVHVVWFDNATKNAKGELHYLVMDDNGGVVVPETNVTAGFYADEDWSEPEIVVDSQGDAHVFFVTEGWNGSTYNWRDIWYTMIDGNTGNVLINNTQLTNSSQTWKNSRPFVDIDSGDMIHIVWHNGTTEQETEIFYMKIDPYLDDRNGNSADPRAIKVVDEMLVSEDDGVKSYLANIAADEHGMAHMVWINEWQKNAYSDIYYGLVNGTGHEIIPESRITYANGTLNFAAWYESSNRNPEIAVDRGRVFIVDMAQDENTGYHDVWMTIAFVDKTPPSTSISYTAYSSAGKDWLSASSKISLSAYDAESGVSKTYYEVDGGSWQVYGSSFNLSSLADGSHTISYYSADNFGNEENTKTAAVFLDKTPTNIETPTRYPTGDIGQGQSVNIYANVTDSGSGVNSTLVTLSYSFDNGTSWASAKMDYNSTSGLFEAALPKQFYGTWVSFKISASDNVGNTVTKDNSGLNYVYQVIPEFSAITLMAIFMALSLVVAVLAKKGRATVR